MNEEQAREILGDTILPNNILYRLGNGYIHWWPNTPEITLDGEFDAKELEAIVWWVNNHTK